MFSFLVYFLESGYLFVEKTTIAKFLERIVHLCEQGADSVRIGQYVKNWLK